MTSTEIANASKIMLGSTEAVKMYIGSTLIYQAWTPNTNGHAYVDLGLPSGTVWATTNIGASNVTDEGDCYTYGGNTPYAYVQDIQNVSYYKGYLPHLPPSKDIVILTWGGDWHIPTIELILELVDNTTYTWENNFNGSGINGGKFTASNGNYIFLPTKESYAANYRSSTSEDSSWSIDLNFRDSYINALSRGHRTNTYFIRPVADSSGYANNTILPSGYTELQYIDSTSSGGLYIDLNIKLYETANNVYDIATKFALNGGGLNNPTQATFFGCQKDASPYSGTFIRKNGNNVQGRYIGGSAKDNILCTIGTTFELAEKSSPDKNVYTSVGNSTHNWGTSLFCYFSDANNTPSRYALATLYYFKLWLNGNLVRYLIPCKNSNNVVGMYDIINDVFYTSPNGNAFVAGPAV